MRTWVRSTSPKLIHPLLQQQLQSPAIISTSLTATTTFSNLLRTLPTLYSINPATGFQAYIETCCSLLKSFSDQSSIRQGKSLHGHVVKMGISSEGFIATKLLIMYLKVKLSVDVHNIFKEMGGFNLVAWNCLISTHAQDGNLEEACRLFNEMPERNVVSWTALISGLMKHGRLCDAMWYFERNPVQNVVSWTAMINGFITNGSYFEGLMFFRRMVACGTAPNAITFTSILRACFNVSEFGFGRTVLGLIVKTGYEHNLSVCNSLITFHIKMREIDLARRVFDGMPSKDVVSWTAILDLYVEQGELNEARRIFDQIPEKNEVSWSAMIARYRQNGEAEEALKLFNRMLSEGLKPTVSCFSCVLSVSASLEALVLGMNIHAHVIKIGIDENVFIGSPLIDMYSKCGNPEDGRQVFDQISEKNVVCWNSIIAGYSYNDRFEEALTLFNQVPNRNAVSWNALITSYVQNEHCEKALEVFNYMLLSDEIPNETTFSSVLRACASLASLEKGKNLHGKIVKLGIQYEVVMGTALTDMYAKSGDIESSKKVFDRMPKKNEISWTAMIQGLADNGFMEESLIQFEEMRRTEINPTELVFLSVLFACSHCGLVDKGFEYFESMKNDYGFKPRGRHYTCMVDLLARAGRLSEAEEFIQTIAFKPEANTWVALLSGCSTYGNKEIGDRTARKLWELEKENSAGYILLSNIYASAGGWSDVLRVRKLMREKGLKKCGGCSWVEVRNHVHTFFVRDECHPESAKIYWMLDLLMSEMSHKKVEIFIG